MAHFAGLLPIFLFCLAGSAQEVAFPIGDGKIHSIIYGNRQYGYFETKEFEVSNRTVRVQLIPPGYKFDVEFYAGKTKLGTHRFPDLIPEPFRKPVGLQIGRFTSNYFLVPNYQNDSLFSVAAFELTRYLPVSFQKELQGKIFLQVVNRFGEIVWIHVPGFPPPSTNLGIESHLFRAANGYGIATSDVGRTVIELFDWKNQVLLIGDAKYESKTYLGHHDFHYMGFGKVRTFSKTRRAIKGKNYFGDSLVEIDIPKHQTTVLWDSFASLHPESETDWKEDENGLVPAPRQLVDSYSAKTKGFDFTHFNSLFCSEKGCLISSRSLSKVILLDPRLKEIVWTMGESKRNTFKTSPTSRFYQQHHVTFLPSGHLLLFDNGKARSRVIEISLNSKSGTADLVKEFLPKIDTFSKIHGAAYQLPNQNIVGLFPLGAETERIQSFLIEFDYETGQERARLLVYPQLRTSGYRILPTQTIGPETFLGERVF